MVENHLEHNASLSGAVAALRQDELKRINEAICKAKEEGQVLTQTGKKINCPLINSPLYLVAMEIDCSYGDRLSPSPKATFSLHSAVSVAYFVVRTDE